MGEGEILRLWANVGLSPAVLREVSRTWGSSGLAGAHRAYAVPGPVGPSLLSSSDRGSVYGVLAGSGGPAGHPVDLENHGLRAA